MLRRSVFGVRTAAALASSAFQPRRQQSSGGRQQPPGGRGGVQRGDAQAAERDLRARQQMEQMQRMQAEQQQQRGAPDEEEDFNPEPPKKPENSQYVKVEDREGGIKVLRMCRAPVNSLNLEFFQELCDWFMWLASEEAGTKAVVLTSGVKTVFSAGLDINELNKPEPQRFGDFWTLFQETWLLMNAFPLPLIACVNGNAPAGGCILAMCCDYRVMARASVKDPANPKPYRIGLNETKLGIVAPPWVMKSLAYTIGERQAEKMLVLGETPTADEALKIGLVDRVEEEAEVEAAALQEAARFAAIPSNARWMSKDLMRQELVSFFPTEKERQYDTEFFGRMIQEPSVVENVSKYLARLGGSKKQ